MSPIRGTRHRLKQKPKFKPEPPKTIHRCDKCGEVYPTLRSLKSHRREPHTGFTTVDLGEERSKSFPVDPFYAGIDYTKRVELQYELKDIIDENDDGLPLDEALSYYEEPRKLCGCRRCCYNKNCCSGADGGGRGCWRGCKCHCDLDVPDLEDSEYESNDDEDMDLDFSDVPPELQKKYERQYRMREGFDLQYKDYCIKKYRITNRKALPKPMGPLSRCSLKIRDRVKKFAVLAIKRYNQMNPGKNYKCLQFLDANVRYGGEKKYFITFIAADYAAAGGYILEPPKTFQAKIGFFIAGGGKTYVTRVLFCRQAEVEPVI